MYTAFTTQEKQSMLAFIDRALEALTGGASFVSLTANEKVVVMNSLLDSRDRIISISPRSIAEGYTEDGAWVHPDSNGAFITWD